MNPRRIGLALALLAVFAAGVALHVLIARLRSAPDASANASAAVSPAPPAAPAPSAAAEPAPRASANTAATADVRAQVRAVVERDVRPLEGRERVERYLDQLEQQARSQGRVTALEVEPGIAALENLSGELGPAATAERVALFTERMRRLSAQLDGRDGPPAPAPDIASLAAQVERAADPQAREAAVRDYVAAANQLAPAAYPQAMERLNELVLAPGAATP